MPRFAKEELTKEELKSWFKKKLEDILNAQAEFKGVIAISKALEELKTK